MNFLPVSSRKSFLLFFQILEGHKRWRLEICTDCSAPWKATLMDLAYQLRRFDFERAYSGSRIIR
jgi:hypothetical protein